LTKLRRGIDFTLGALGVGLLGPLILSILLLPISGDVPVAPLLLLGILSFAVGAILVTTQEPRVRFLEPPWVWRRVVRICLPVCAGAYLLAGWGSSLSPPLWAILLSQLPAWSAVLLLFACFTHLHALALRIPNAKLASSARIIKWGLTSPCVLAYGVRNAEVVLAMLAPSSGGMDSFGNPPNPQSLLPDSAWIALGACLLAFSLLAVVLVIRFRLALRNAIGEAMRLSTSAIVAESTTYIAG
jgi:hypothetical protein